MYHLIWYFQIYYLTYVVIHKNKVGFINMFNSFILTKMMCQIRWCSQDISNNLLLSAAKTLLMSLNCEICHMQITNQALRKNDVNFWQNAEARCNPVKLQVRKAAVWDCIDDIWPTQWEEWTGGLYYQNFREVAESFEDWQRAGRSEKNIKNVSDTVTLDRHPIWPLCEKLDELRNC